MMTIDASQGEQKNALGIPSLDTLIVLDTETTGLDHKNEKIIEIAAVKMVKGEITETYSQLVNPQAKIRHSSFKIHNISEEMVADAPTIDAILPSFLEFVQDFPYAAHNAIFDYSFINEATKAHLGKRFSNHRIDTFDMYRSVFPDEPSHSLSSLLERLGIPQVIKHRALDDAQALASVFFKLRELYEQKQAWKLSQLENIDYLVERYLRIQRTIQVLQGEMSDLKEVFKLYFTEGGKPIESSSGEVMVSSYRRSYEYNESQVRKLLMEFGLVEQAYKLNLRALDKLVEKKQLLTEEQHEQLVSTRLSVNESRVVSFIKPQAPSPGGTNTATKEEKESSSEKAPSPTREEPSSNRSTESMPPASKSEESTSSAESTSDSKEPVATSVPAEGS